MIFISYSWNDKNEIKPILENIINEFGEDKVYLDQKDNKIGEDYWLNIKNGLKTCKFFIFFNSKNYINSAACGNELLIALDMQKKIKILQIKLDKTPSHQALIRKIYLQYTNSKDVSSKIIESIYNQNFTGFEMEKIVKSLEIKRIKKENYLLLKFNVSNTLYKPSFIFEKSSISKMNIIYVNMKNGTFRTELIKNKSLGEATLVDRFSPFDPIYHDDKVEIKIENFSPKDFFALGIHDENKGTPKKRENYEYFIKKVL